MIGEKAADIIIEDLGLGRDGKLDGKTDRTDLAEVQGLVNGLHLTNGDS